LNVFQGDALLHAPQHKFFYSTHGFTLLSAVMESAANIPYLDYIKKTVLIPLELTDTYPESSRDIVYHRPRYYERQKNLLLNAPFVDLSNKWAGGGFVSTADNLARLGGSFLSDHHSLLSKETIKLIFTPQIQTCDGKSTNYGLGWSIKERSEHSPYQIFHSGGAVGASSHILLLPDEKICVALICNLSDCSLSSLASDVAKFFIKYPTPSPSSPSSRPGEIQKSSSA